MSSLLTYTLTNRRSSPPSKIRSFRPGWASKTWPRTSPTVEPAASTLSSPAAWGRSGVGILTTGMSSVLDDASRWGPARPEGDPEGAQEEEDDRGDPDRGPEVGQPEIPVFYGI